MKPIMSLFGQARPMAAGIDPQCLEEYALNPEARRDLVQSYNPGTAEYYLLRLRLLSQELQDPSSPITLEKIEEATNLLSQAEVLDDYPKTPELKQFRSQLALLAYSVKPELLLEQLKFNPDSVTHLNSINPAENEEQEGGSGSAVGGNPQGLCDLLPTVLDNSAIEASVLLDRLLDELTTFSSSTCVPYLAWPHVLSHPKAENLLLQVMPIDNLRKLFAMMEVTCSPQSLTIVGQTDVSRVDELVVKVLLRLYQERKLDFTHEVRQFKFLTSAQLEMIKTQVPSVMMNEGFVGLLEKRILPRVFADSEESRQGAVYGEWLARMVEFVDTLAPKFNRYKMAVYLMSLEFDLAKGVMDKDKFMGYIRIPRNHNSYNNEMVKWATKENQLVDTNNSRRLEFWSSRVQPVTKARDEEVVKEHLSYFMRQEKSTADYESFFEVNSFLYPLLARVMLTSGDQDIAKWSSMLPFYDDLSKLTEQTIIEFAPNNPETFLPSEPVVFRLKVKNAKRILVRVFEVKTLEYLQQYEGPVGQALNLDGLTPNWEHTLTSDYPSLEIHDLTIKLPELADRRGSFVMDVISNGGNSTAYFTKGNLDYIERQSVAGHILTIIDENMKKVTENVSIWLNGIYYQTNEDGDIVIPYRKPSTDAGKDIYITHNDFTNRRPFVHHAESYSMTLSYYVDQESLLAGSIAKILLKPIVKINSVDVICPVDLLEQVSLEVVLSDTNGIDSITTVPEFKVHDADWSEYKFQVPENLSLVKLALSAKIKVLSTGEFEDLSDSKDFSIEENCADQVVTVQLKNQKQDVQIDGEILTVLRKTDHGNKGYEILVMGKNGEKRPNIPLEFEFNHPIWPNPLDIYLRSDADGIILLGDLQEITSFDCKTSDVSWDLQFQVKYPDVIHGIAGEPVRVPCSRTSAFYIRSVSLFRCSMGTWTDQCYLEDATNKIKLSDGMLTVSDLTTGYYTLRIGDVSIDLVISNPKTSQHITGILEKFHIESNPMLEILDSAKYPLFLSPTTVDNSDQLPKINIRVHNWTPETRVCVIASKFVPNKPMIENMAVVEFERLWSKEQAERTSTTYRTGRILGEEYQYILNRKAQSKHWAGNLLTKPSVLLTPWSIGDTTAAEQEMADQNLANVRGKSTAFGNSSYRGRGLGKGGARRMRSFLPHGAPQLISFLANPSAVLANLIPDPSTSVVTVPYTEIKEGSFLQILVTDGAQAVQDFFVVQDLVKTPIQKRDLRFRSPLDHTKHYIGERTGINLDPKLSSAGAASTEPHCITLASSGSSSSAVRVINSVGQVYDLMMTLLETEQNKQNLRKFGFIVDWHRFSKAVKDEKYSKWNCHELNLFLYKKDKPYFDEVVAPFIKNKLVKSFMDDYLIGASLEKYTALKEFDFLSCLEKCLLAHRIPRLKHSVAQWIRSRVHNTKVASDVKLFRTVMNSGAIEELKPSSPDLRKEKEVDLMGSRSEGGGGDAGSDKGAEDFEMVESAPLGASVMNAQRSTVATASLFGAPAGSAPGGGGFGGFGGFGTQAAPGSSSIFGFQAPPAPQALAAPMTSALFCAASAPPPPLHDGVSYSPTSPSYSPTSPPYIPVSPSAPVFGGAGAAAQSQSNSGNPAHHSLRIQAEQKLQSQFKPVDLTKEMAETYYWGRQDKSGTSSSTDVNAFWLDFVEWDESSGGSFLSQNFVVNTQTFTSAMATIALLGVTFKPKEAIVKRSVDHSLTVSSLSPAIVFHSSTKELSETLITGSVLITQQYFGILDQKEYDSKLMTNVRKYIQPSTEMRPLISYGAHVVLMNATPSPMKLHVEVQLPYGAISIHSPLESGQDIQLEAHRTFQYEYSFYFPEEGDFPHYPAHVSNYEDIVAFASPSVLKVRTANTGQSKETVDTTTWNYVLTRGSQEDVLSKLAIDPLDGMRVEQLIPRLYRDKTFLRRVTGVLRDRHEYNDRIWSVSLVLKGDEAYQLQLVREYVANQEITQKVGYWFTSALLTRRPESHYESVKDAFHYLEYFPLINARAHKATKKTTILNGRFKAQYERFLTLLSQKPYQDVDDLLILIVYLLAQDRILEAKTHFVKLSALVTEGNLENELEGQHNFQQIQYDYLRAYLSLCVEVEVDTDTTGADLDLEGIQVIVDKYQDYPVQRWNRLFKEMKIYVDEILRASMDTPASAEDDDTVMVSATQEASLISTGDDTEKTVPVTVEFKIGSNSQVVIHHRGVGEVMVEYYVIDAETMFSASPLTFSDQGQSETNFAANKSQAAGASSSSGSGWRTNGVMQARLQNLQHNTPFTTQFRPSPPSSSSADSTSYRLVKPNGVDKHTVERAVSDVGVLRVPILDKYVNTNVMISVTTVPPAATKTWKAYYSQTISVQVQELSGTIRVVTKSAAEKEEELSEEEEGEGNVRRAKRVRHNKNRRRGEAIRGGYVKVYAEMKNGPRDTVFWKDGYTDLVGRFDYATVSTGASTGAKSDKDGGLAGVKRFVLFVDGGKEGCVVKTVPVPSA